MAEHVELDLPLSAKYASTVRTVAASLAAQVGLTIQEIDDLRLGVNEAISVLTDVEPSELDGGSARLSVRFDVEHDRIQVVAFRTGVDRVDVEIDVLAHRILTAVVDDFAIDDAGVFTLSKLVSTDAGS